MGRETSPGMSIHRFVALSWATIFLSLAGRLFRVNAPIVGVRAFKMVTVRVAEQVGDSSATYSSEQSSIIRRPNGRMPLRQELT